MKHQSRRRPLTQFARAFWSEQLWFAEWHNMLGDKPIAPWWFIQ